MTRPDLPRSAGRVPTLTEVVAWPPLPAAAEEAPRASAGDAPGLSTAPWRGAPVLRLAEDAIIQGILQQLQRQVDLMLEYRVREVLTPLLARALDGVVRDARAELASTLRDMVARAVADELARRRAP